MENIGSVVYTLTDTGIKADWVFSNQNKISRGTGGGIRKSPFNEAGEFEGDFEIVYWDLEGKASPKLDLKISCDSGFYKLIWMYNGEVTDMGVGIRNQNTLSVGWHRVINEV